MAGKQQGGKAAGPPRGRSGGRVGERLSLWWFAELDENLAGKDGVRAEDWRWAGGPHKRSVTPIGLNPSPAVILFDLALPP